jgi:hypothetical protein
MLIKHNFVVRALIACPQGVFGDCVKYLVIVFFWWNKQYYIGIFG